MESTHKPNRRKRNLTPFAVRAISGQAVAMSAAKIMVQGRCAPALLMPRQITGPPTPPITKYTPAQIDAKYVALGV